MSDPIRPTPVRVLLADDHVTVRYGLKMIVDAEPDMTVVGEAGDGDEAIRKTIDLKPDVVVMDISMPGTNGLAATRALKQAHPEIHVITLTRHTDDAYLHELLRAGASGYILKRSAPTELLHAIRGVAAGGQYVDSSLTSRVTASFVARPTRKPTQALSDREAQVLRLIAAGYGNKEIGAQLSLSAKTVDAHKINAMRKLDLHGRIDIVKYAVLQGWLDQT